MANIPEPPELADMPDAPDRAQRETFESRAVAWAKAQIVLVKQVWEVLPWLREAINAQAADVTGAAGSASSAHASAVSAANSALAAQSALGAKTWKAGAAYAVNDMVFGVIRPGNAYRCYAAVSGSATPPEDDPAHWAGIGLPSATFIRTASEAGAMTADFAARAGQWYDCDTSGGGFALQLPAQPGFGDWVGINDIALRFGDAPLTVRPAAGDRIEGQTSALVMDAAYRGYLVYRGGARGWIV